MKRKRANLSNTSNKRVKAATPQSSQTEYLAKEIVAENKTCYYISWEDDAVTGEQYQNTWEPKRNANERLVDDWQRHKAARSKAPKQLVSAPSTPKRSRGRPRKIIESSSPTEELRQSEPELLEIDESQQTQGGADANTNAESPLFEAEEQSPVGVYLSEPPSSYQAGEYQTVESSQIVSDPAPSAQKSPEPSQYLPDRLDSSKTTEETNGVSDLQISTSENTDSVPRDTERPPRLSGIVADSQSGLWSSSYIPSGTQAESSSGTSIQARADEALDSQPPDLGTNITDRETDPQERAELGESSVLATTVGFNPDYLTTGQAAPQGNPSNSEARPSTTENLSISHGTASLQQLPAGSTQAGVGTVPGASHAPKEKEAAAVLTRESTQVQKSSEPPSARQPRKPASTVHAGQQGVGSAHVDLTTVTQNPQTSSRSFSLTPPTRKAIRSGQRDFQSAPSSFSLESPFLFRTQIAGSSRGPFGPSQSPGYTGRPAFQDQRIQLSPSTVTQAPETASSLPLERGTTALESSSIPAPPSQSIEIDTLHEQVPPRPSTPSSPVRSTENMENSNSTPNSQGSLRDRLKTMRAQHKDKLDKKIGDIRASSSPSQGQDNARSQLSMSGRSESEQVPLAARVLAPSLLAAPDRARSPSTVPHAPVLPVITREEMTTSGRYASLVPQAQADSADDERRKSSYTSVESQRAAETQDQVTTFPNVHAVPICLVGHQRDQYPQTVYHRKDFIERFLASDHPDEAMHEEAEGFVEQMRNVTMHPDLDNSEVLTQYDDLKPSQRAQWDVSCSAKFRFLKDLLDALRGTHVCVLVVSKSERLLEMLATFMEGINISHLRYPPSSDAYSDTALVMLLNSDADHLPIGRLDILIAMDNSSELNSSLLKSFRDRCGRGTPIITLVVPRSVEHIERHLSPTLSTQAKTRALVRGIYHFRTEAGKDGEVNYSPKEPATALAAYLKGTENDPTWPLPALSNIEIFDSQTDSEVDHGENAADLLAPPMIGQKRVYDAADEGLREPSSNKRSRVSTPVPEQGSQLSSSVVQPDFNITHISDSVDNTNPADAPVAVIDSTELLTPNEKRLQDLLIAAQDRLREHVDVLSDLQYRFEEQRGQLVDVTSARDSAIATAQSTVTRLSEDSNRMSALRTELSRLKDELKEANSRLLDHSVPERAELEALRQAAAQLESEKARVDKRLEQSNKDLDYVRGMYQNTSNRAQQLASQTTELESELAVAQNKATGEHVKLRQMGYDAFTKNLQSENRKLKILLRDRDEGLRLRDEEVARLKEASRGRMGTRGTSVPRSPRMNSPKKAVERMGSRQGSPAVGGEQRARAGLHPLRNA